MTEHEEGLVKITSHDPHHLSLKLDDDRWLSVQSTHDGRAEIQVVNDQDRGVNDVVVVTTPGALLDEIVRLLLTYGKL
jgi:hypothetical protein